MQDKFRLVQQCEASDNTIIKKKKKALPYQSAEHIQQIKRKVAVRAQSKTQSSAVHINDSVNWSANKPQ